MRARNREFQCIAHKPTVFTVAKNQQGMCVCKVELYLRGLWTIAECTVELDCTRYIDHCRVYSRVGLYEVYGPLQSVQSSWTERGVLTIVECTVEESWTVRGIWTIVECTVELDCTRYMDHCRVYSQVGRSEAC